MTEILVVDDEAPIRRTLRTALGSRGFSVRSASTAGEALAEMDEGEPDLMILDLGLPDLDGVEVITRVRQSSEVPIIVLSVRGSESDKVQALDAGADDYVTKPFGIEEVFARIRATLRRRSAEESQAFESERLRIDLATTTVLVEGEPVHLTRLEWRILEMLVGNIGSLVGQRELLQRVWGPEYGTETNYLRVYMAQLRRKLEADPSRPRHLITEPAMGYRFVP
jgi:two-component system KDP operon response regulator KdpE